MVSKNQLKLIKSLQQKKYRKELGLFFVEGFKTVNELLNSNFTLSKLYVTKRFIEKFKNVEIEVIEEKDLKKISAMQHLNGIFGVFEIPKPLPIYLDDWVVVLDNVRDPGNLGTIIRLCDWFGIKNIVCSKETVDCFNPKVLQATMGSVARVNITYKNLESFLSDSDLPVYGTFMDGATIYKEEFPKAGILILGNEANGIAPEVESKIKKKITIPQFGQQSTESLNVATATAIVLSKIKGG